MSTTGVIGGALDEMARLKTNFDRQSGMVDELVTSLRTDLDSVYWKGPAADRFRSDWAAQYEPALRNLCNALADAGGEVHNCQQRLEQAGG